MKVPYHESALCQYSRQLKAAVTKSENLIKDVLFLHDNALLPTTDIAKAAILIPILDSNPDFTLGLDPGLVLNFAPPGLKSRTGPSS
ncbi:hypothetical protein EVAR_20439_1 [Eumeta japonica]|uniref:Uncharacterized protein n=1 Tax=Eumeta variegata TaxID=151549 RepID=A0A4C1TY10_EUMVA|nr:hypothetical protein EVAR_20439_1 [Eumeta japonica]